MVRGKREKVRATVLRWRAVMRIERHPKTIRGGRRKMPLRRRLKRMKSLVGTINERALLAVSVMVILAKEPGLIEEKL